jgi:subtilisin family serine protease
VVTGTSFATPTVTGLCALLLGIAPDLRPYEVKAALKGLAS